MHKVKYLYNKTILTLKEEGIKSFINKTKNYLKSAKNKKEKYCKDVLFINGCSLPHPSRYRVDHQREQLESNGMSTDTVFYENLNLDMQKYYRSFVFFRCPITEEIKIFIQKAKENNKTIFFDIDDLVFDKEYTKSVKYLSTISKEEKDLYYDGVNRMQSTLKLCDYATTTTETLANELNKFVKETFINRNSVSEKMAELSLEAINNVKKDESKIILGYLSGSITHNPDFEMIASSIEKIMNENNNVYLKIVGYLDIPNILKKYENRITFIPFTNWINLPNILASIDINLAPLEDTLFNRAKSENKWTEASLVKTITLASNVGAFREIIKNNYDGILTENTEENWYNNLNNLIKDEKLRIRIKNNAHQRVLKEYVTTYSGFEYTKFIKSKLTKSISFVLPSTNISGGVNVVIKHCNILKKKGYDTFIINMDNNEDNIINTDGEIDVISSEKVTLNCHIDKMVATLWSTLYYILNYHKVKQILYLVQSFETNFITFGNYVKQTINSTYSFENVEYLTISKWCEKWLKEDFDRSVKYAPNGIDRNNFFKKERKFDKKIRILVEGDSENYYKNVDESFKIIDLLDKEKFEIWYLSYQGKSKSWYYYDKFYCKIPHDKVAKVYQECDILIKTSILESFSYPPLEMMSTGGISVVIPNEGNIEYLKDNENCLFYESGNINDAVKKINMLINDKKLRDKLILNGEKTAKKYEWENISDKILNLYFGDENGE